jgi:epoxyqueuosine reductase
MAGVSMQIWDGSTIVSVVPDVAELVALGRAHGLDAVGVAPAEPFGETRRILEERKAAGLHGGMAFTYRKPERSTDPTATVPGATALVVGARSYRRSTPAQPTDRPVGVVARYAQEDHYAPLREALEVVGGRLRADGWTARVLVDDNALVDRAAAHRAGLGWYGKNANLLLPGQGSWFVLGSVLTNAPLVGEDAPTPVPDGCGACTRCLDSCPTGAIVAPGVVDARRCLAWLVQATGPFPRRYRAALGNRIYGCDDCQEVCPPNRRVSRDRSEDAHTSRRTGASSEVDLVEMLELSDEELLARYGRWYIPRREPRYLRRNALVVLGNVADRRDPRVVATLRRALRDPDPLVRGHAVWMARRLGRDDLLVELADDPDPGVRDELTAPVEVLQR